MTDTAHPETPKVCLQVLIPAALESRAVDWLLMHPQAGIEFSAHAVAARGPLMRLAHAEERVQGFAQRVELKLICDRAQLQALLAELRELMSGVDGGYWVTPVEHFQAFPGHAGAAQVLP